MTAAEFLQRFKGVKKGGKGWTCRCPAHPDKQSSLSVSRVDGKWLLKCHAGCTVEEIAAALGIKLSDLFDRPKGAKLKGGGAPIHIPPNNQSSDHPKHGSGLTLEAYAAAKKLPIEFLRGCGLSDCPYEGNPAVRMPYLGPLGEVLAVRFRLAERGDNRFRWKSGTKVCLYGLNRIEQAREAGRVVLVEGESDCQTLWHHGIAAVGLPGAASWNEDRDAQHFEGIDSIFIVIEPDKGGEAVKKWLAQSRIRHRASIVELPAPAKDASALHLEDESTFKKRWQVALLGAVPWSAIEEKDSAEERSESWNACADLAQEHAILDLLDDELTKLGMVGERRCAKLVYLAVTSRLLERPVSVAVKGPSAGGKSFMVETTLRLFPPQAFHAMTAMSEKAVAYSNEPLKHRMLVIYEAAGMASEFGSYLIRSLLSEGRLRYETVEKTREGLAPKVIEREGPTGLITTTTAIRLHPENETRLLSLSVTDTQEQTRAVFSALAEANNEDRNVEEWQALQTWLAAGSRAVIVPFAKRLASLVPPVAVRLRRDFKMILNLIRAHALLHQAQRQKDENGRILATVREDYASVRNLVADLVAAGVETGVPKTIQETVKAVAAIIAESPALTETKEVNQTELAARLKLDKAAVSRRVADCLERGYLRNLEERRPGKGRPARLVLGDQLPSEQDILPDPELVDPLIGCSGGKASSPPPSSPNGNGAGLPVCITCGRRQDDPGDPLTAHNVGGRRVWVHAVCLPFWKKQGRPTERPSADGWSA